MQAAQADDLAALRTLLAWNNAQATSNPS